MASGMEFSLGVELVGVATTTAEDLRRLEDRRAMETREELYRIDRMGRVSYY